MRKYRVSLTVGNILTIRYTLKAFSDKHALYKAKLITFIEDGNVKFNKTYVEKIKGGENNGRN